MYDVSPGPYRGGREPARAQTGAIQSVNGCTGRFRLPRPSFVPLEVAVAPDR